MREPSGCVGSGRLGSSHVLPTFSGGRADFPGIEAGESLAGACRKIRETERKSGGTGENVGLEGGPRLGTGWRCGGGYIRKLLRNKALSRGFGCGRFWRV